MKERNVKFKGKRMGELIFIGMGLYSEKSMSIEALEVVRSVDLIYLERYTSIMPGLNIARLRNLLGRDDIIEVKRSDLEENMHKIISEAQSKKVAILIPGDPFIATTHMAIRVEAEKKGIKTRVIHGVSILTAIPGITGLHAYKFGRVVTVTFPNGGRLSETPYDVTKTNLKCNLHTVLLLDIRVEEGRYMTIKDAISILEELESIRGEGVFSDDRLVIGIARAGSPDCKVRADILCNIKTLDFGPPPHCIVVPASLHFTEAEALVVLAKAPKEIVMRMVVK